MNTTILTELENKFIGKWIKCYQYVDEWSDFVYTLDRPSGEYSIVFKQICDINSNYRSFTLSFEVSGDIDIWCTEEFELYSNKPIEQIL